MFIQIFSYYEYWYHYPTFNSILPFCWDEFFWFFFHNFHVVIKGFCWILCPTLARSKYQKIGSYWIKLYTYLKTLSQLFTNIKYLIWYRSFYPHNHKRNSLDVWMSGKKIMTSWCVSNCPSFTNNIMFSKTFCDLPGSNIETNALFMYMNVSLNWSKGFNVNSIFKKNQKLRFIYNKWTILKI